MKRFLPIIFIVFLCCAFFGSPKIETDSDKNFRDSIIKMLDSLNPDNRKELAKYFSLILTNGKSETDITLTAQSSMRLGCSLQDVYTLCEQNAQWGNKTYLNNLNSLDGYTFDDLRKRATVLKKTYQTNKAKEETEWRSKKITQLQQKLVKTKSSISDIKKQENKIEDAQAIITVSKNYAKKIKLKTSETPIKDKVGNYARSINVHITLSNNGDKSIHYLRFKTTVNDTKEKRVREYFNELKLAKPINSGSNLKKIFKIGRIAYFQYPPQGVKITTTIDQIITTDCYNIVVKAWNKRFSGGFFYKDATRMLHNKKAELVRAQDYLLRHKQWLEKTINLIEAGKIKNKHDESEKMGFEPSQTISNNF
ncbi:hypothetical protein [Maridesulfovibrio sp.]|uniref:hypothetical protein n=1 Tax=Maridesulfovibrio sp. TaxID=2795000 RepID=UPI0029CA97DD|nr:hypothetical protein [Maridesulfovibrio sp.]